MKLMTWVDAITTLLTGAIVAVYVAFLSGTSLWLISSGRGATAVVLVLGMGAWALRLLNPGTGYRTALDFAWVATMICNVALLVAVFGLFTGSTVALTILVVGTVALWLITTMRRASSNRIEAENEPAVDNVTPLERESVSPRTHSHGAQGLLPLNVGIAAKRRSPRTRTGRTRPTGQLSDRPIAREVRLWTRQKLKRTGRQAADTHG